MAKNKSNEKLVDRATLLIERTTKILNVTANTANDFFSNKKSTVILMDNRASDLISYATDKGFIKKLEWFDGAFIIEENKEFFTKSSEFENGYIFIQNASSLLPVIAIAPKPNEKILDMCAAPGGKTLQVSHLTNKSAVITVNDENSARVEKMKKLFTTFNVEIGTYISQPAQYLYKHLEPDSFDKILIDAPCSGEGLININDSKSLGFWSLKKIRRLSKLQKMIVASGEKLLKKGGEIIYSTCTLAPEENEDVVSWASKKANLEIVPINTLDKIGNLKEGLSEWNGQEFINDIKHTKRIIPNEHMEAFFVAKLKKS